MAAPLAASAAWPEGWFLYKAFEPFCHQQAGRSWSIQGFPLAVCVRCGGVYLGLLLAGLVGWRLRARALAAGLALVGASWAAEFLGGFAVSGSIRFATGLALGFAAGGVVLAYLGLSTKLSTPSPHGSESAEGYPEPARQEPVLE